MKTQEILSIVALGLLGVCLLCGLAKMAMKGPKAKQTCNHACSLSFFAAVVLLGVSQLITEEGYGTCRAFKLDKDQGVDLNDCLDAAHGGKGNGENCFVQNDGKLPCGPWTWSLIGESKLGLCQSVPSLCTPINPGCSTKDAASCDDSSACSWDDINNKCDPIPCSDDSNCSPGLQCFNNENDKVCNPSGQSEHDPFQCYLNKIAFTHNPCN